MKRKKVVPIILIFFFAIVSIFFPYDLLFSLTNDMFVTHEELDDILKNDWLISSHVVSVSAKDDNDFDKYIINYKLFNLFNIKKLKVNVVDPDRYFPGGETLGFSLQSKGVIVIGGNYILSKNGIERPFENSGLKTGDIITKIDGIEINNVEDISKILKNFEGGSVSLTVTRSGETFEVEISPALDSMTNTYKLGLWVKEDAVGIGTLSFVNATTKRFGSLGHSINDSETNECIKVSGGNIYESKILGIKKGI